MRGPLLPLALSLLGAACATRDSGRAAASRPAVAPTLAQIFGKPGLDGARPSDLAVSADGRYVSYRLAPGSEGGEDRARARLFVVSSRGGELADLGEVDGAIWLGSGARLVWCVGKEVRAWDAGTPPASARALASLPASGSAPRLSPDGRRLLVSSEGAACLLDPDAPNPRAIETPAGFAVDRILLADAGPAILFRRGGGRPGRGGGARPASQPASRPASAPESRPASIPASAPESLPASAPASMPESAPARSEQASAPAPRYRLAQHDWEGALLRASDFDLPEGEELEQLAVAHDGQGALWSAREGSRGAERAADRGVVPNYLTPRVTTRPAHGGASEPEARRRAGAIALGTDGVLPAPPFDTLRRGSYEFAAIRGPESFFLAWNGEDRSSRRIHAASIRGAGAEARFEARPLLDVPGPVGGIEQLAAARLPVLLSEGTGRARAYALDGDGALRPFTPENLDVTWIGFASSADGRATGTALVADPARPHERRFWRVFQSGSPHHPLPMEGMFASAPALARDGGTVAFLGSTLGSVEEVYAMPTDGSAPPRRLTTTAPEPSTVPGPAVPLSVVRYPSLDGTPVWALLYEPPEGVARNGAAVIFLHGAGYLQQVRASTGFGNYAANHHFHRRLAAQGYVVMAPDFRGSAGYGRQFRVDVFRKLGHPDSEDIVAGKRYLASAQGVDPERVGLYGGSYGGFLTLMCLTLHPREFACGAALRSVTDWRAYQPGYTRPLLGGGPEEAPEVYRACSPLDRADALERPVLLLHGLLDDNVFAQDTLRLVEKLQESGKTALFELMVYPSQNHTFTSPHSWIDEYQRIEDFFARHLLGDGRG